MRLKSLSLKNFRCFTDELIEFDSYTALVGANNAGKSATVAAIDIFFRSNPRSIPLSIDDFFKRDRKRELAITLTFSDLGDAALKEFSHYARGGELTFFIRAKIVDGMVESSLHGMRLANQKLAPFFEMETASEKRKFYESLPKKMKLPEWKSQTQATEALREYENKNPKLNSHIPSDDRAFGVEGPIPRLRHYIDFVYIPAVKDAGDEAIEARNTAFSRLVERAVRANLKVDERIDGIRKKARSEIDAMAKDHQKILGSLENRIEAEYQKFSSTKSRLHLEWGEFEERNLQINLPPVHLQISDDLIRNTIEKFGHGTQRNYLMALLMVSASYDFTELQTIIIACEEPELYQHPPQARILANALYALASNKAQVIVTTHSSYFVTAKSFENIRLIRRTPGQRSKSYSWSIDENRSLIAKAKGEKAIGGQAARAAINQFLQPQVNEMFFAQFVIFVEGEEDRSLLSKYFQMRGKYAEMLIRGVHIVPINGKGNMINALSVARGFEIPFFAIADGDMTLKKSEDKKRNLKLNKDILSIIQYAGSEKDGSINSDLYGKNFCIWKDCLQTSINDCLPDWENEKTKVCKEFGWTIDRLRKNAMVLEAALERVYKDKPILPLERLCSSILMSFQTSRSVVQ